MHPVLHEVRAHLGIDYAAPVGTPVWAAAGGTISFRGDGAGAGNLVMIKHDSGIETAYMHLSKFGTEPEYFTYQPIHGHLIPVERERLLKAGWEEMDESDQPIQR